MARTVTLRGGPLDGAEREVREFFEGGPAELAGLEPAYIAFPEYGGGYRRDERGEFCWCKPLFQCQTKGLE